MKQKIMRPTALIFLLAALLLSACVKTQAPAEPVPENTPASLQPAETPRAEGGSAEPTVEPVPEPTHEPEPWREAYMETAAQCEQEFPPQEGGGMKYDLIDFDGDEIPELAAGMDGYFVSLYTYRDGEVCTLMDCWGYGAMGNYGYEYCPGKNSLRNYNSDYAGLVMNTTYMAIGTEGTLEVTASVVTRNFNDVNGNGEPDLPEEYEFVENGLSFADGVAISAEELTSFDAGEYEYITGRWSYDELLAELGK